MKLGRTSFMKMAVGAAGAAAFGNWRAAFAAGTKAEDVGKVWKGWKPGEFQVHFIYTGVGESMFIIFPDSTTMLFDCGDHAAVTRLDLAVPVLPGLGITVLGLYHVGSRERALK